MASPVYSVFLFRGHDLGSPIDVYLDPSFVYVMREIDIFFPGDAVGTSCLVIDPFSGGTIFGPAQAVVASPGANFHLSTRQVFVPEEGVPTFTVSGQSSVGDGPDCRISGYQLSLP